MKSFRYWNQELLEVSAEFGYLSLEEEGIAQRLAREYLRAKGELEFNENVLRRKIGASAKQYDDAFKFVTKHIFTVKDGMLFCKFIDSVIVNAREKSLKAQQSAYARHNGKSKNKKQVNDANACERSANAVRTHANYINNKYINNNKKNNNKKNDAESLPAKKNKFSDKHFELAKNLKEGVKRCFPRGYEKFCLDKAANTIRLMEDTDKIPIDFIEKAIEFFFIPNGFWESNIGSADKFRKQAKEQEGKITAYIKSQSLGDFKSRGRCVDTGGDEHFDQPVAQSI